MDYIKSSFTGNKSDPKDIFVNDVIVNEEEQSDEPLQNDDIIEYDDESGSESCGSSVCSDENDINEKIAKLHSEYKYWKIKEDLVKSKYNVYLTEKFILDLYLNNKLPTEFVCGTELFKHITQVYEGNNEMQEQNFFMKASKSIKDLFKHHDTLLKLSLIFNTTVSIYIGFMFNYFR